MEGPEVRPDRRGQALPLVVATVAGIAVAFLFVGSHHGSTRLALRAAPQAAAGSVVFVPASAHAAGANGANWRTDLEVHNAASTTGSFTLQLLVRDANNASPASRSYTLGPNQSRRFNDVLISEFGTEGAAALRVVVSAGSLVVTSRTYNQLGANPWGLPQGASFGQYVPGFEESGAIGAGQEGRLFHLTQHAAATLDGFRTNLGIVNTTASPIDVRIDLHRANGTYLGTKDGAETGLPPYGFRQLNEVFAAWGLVTDGYAVVKTTTPGGRLFAFATVIDNHNSGDPIFVPAVVLGTASSSPTPSPTPSPTTAVSTRTPTPPATLTPTSTPTSPAGGRPNLYLYKPSGWQACFSAHYQTGCCSTSSCCSPFLSTHYSAFLSVFVANSGNVTLTGPVRLRLAVDGTTAGYASWANPDGLEPGYGAVLSWEHTSAVAAGTHTLTMTVDPDDTIPESNEGDNSCTTSATWTSIVFRGPEAGRPAGTSFAEAVLRGGDVVRLPEGPARPSLAAPSGPIYIPASAHASGANGASWRTDVEVHNPGTTAALFSMALLKQATDNGGSVPTKTFSLGPQQSVRYVDVLATVFETDGAAAIRLTPQVGTILANSRTYNLIGENSAGLPVGASFGQFVPGLFESEAIGDGEEGRIIQLTHRDASSLADFRSNVGYLNTTGAPIDLRIDLFSASGSLMATIQDARTHLRPYEFLQLNGIFGAYTGWLEAGYVVIRTTTPGGRFFAFATVIDNHLTGDPIFIPATKLSGSTLPPTPTSTPPTTPTSTRTPTPSATATTTPRTPTPTPTATPTSGSGDQPVTTSTTGQTVTVTQPGTLKDLAFTFPSAPPAGFTVWSVAPAQVPAIPDGVTRLSDFFRVSRVQATDGLITITLPVSGLPAGRSAKDLRLYVYTDAAEDAGPGSSFTEPFWIRTWYDLQVLASGKATIKLQGLGDVSFLGIEAPVAPAVSSPGTSLVRTRRGLLAVTVACQAKALPNGTTDANQQVCTAGYDVGKSFTVTVKNLGDLHLAPAATLNELVGWLAAGRLAFDGYGLVSDPAFEVDVGAMPADIPNAFGFVTTSNLEDRRVLHITNKANAKNAIQGTAVHEYFHHAQSRTKAAGKTNLIDTRHKGDWLIEGLARWVEDDIFDSLDTYTLKEDTPLNRILEVGVGPAPDEEHDGRTRGYERFAFWKLVQSKCSGFSIPQILNVDVAADPRGVSTFQSRLQSDRWQCNFGGGFGDANRATLASALLAYSFDSVKNDDLSLMDPNEKYFKFAGIDGLPHIAPSSDCLPEEPCAGALFTRTLPPASAVAFLVDAVSNPPEGMLATLWVTTAPAGGEAFLWAGDAEQLMPNASAGKWTVSTDDATIAYGEPARVPKALAFLVNPSPANPVTVAVRAGYANGLMIVADPAIEPLIDWGRPQKEYTFGAYVAGMDAPATRFVWDFGDGTGTVTVQGDNNVKHTYAREGSFTVAVELFDRATGKRLGRTQSTARIGWFHGSFPVKSLVEQSSSGTVTWDELLRGEELVFNSILSNPASGSVEFIYREGEGRSTWLQVADYVPIAGTGTANIDIPSFMTASGNQLTGRFVLYSYGPSGFTNWFATFWFDTTLVQSGAALSGQLTLVNRRWDDQLKQAVEVGRKVFRLEATRRE